MDEEEDFLGDYEQQRIVANQFKQALAEGRTPYFEAFQFEGVADYFLTEGEEKLAKKALVCGLRFHPNSLELQLKLVSVELYYGGLERTLNLIETLEKIAPNNMELLSLKGLVYMQLNRVEEAIELHQRTDGYEEDLTYDIAHYFHRIGEFEEAIRYWEKLYQKNKNWIHLRQIAVCYSELGDYENGNVYFLKSLEERPLEVSSWLDLGENYYYLNEPLKAIEALDNAIALENTSTRAHFYKGKSLVKLKRHLEATVVFEEYLEMNPDDDKAHFLLADCYLATSQFEKACQHYQRVVELNPENNDARHNIAVAMHFDGRNESALQMMQQLLQLKDNDAYYWETLGLIYTALGRMTEAKEAFEKSISIDARCGQSWVSLSDFALQSDGREAALAVLERGFEQWHFDYRVLARKIVLLVELNRSEEAMKTLKFALDLLFDGQEEFREKLRLSMEELEPTNEIISQIISLIETTPISKLDF